MEELGASPVISFRSCLKKGLADLGHTSTLSRSYGFESFLKL